MKADTLFLAAVPCAIAAASAQGLLDIAMRGWPSLIAVAVVTLGLTARSVHSPQRRSLDGDRR